MTGRQKNRKVCIEYEPPIYKGRNTDGQQHVKWCSITEKWKCLWDNLYISAKIRDGEYPVLVRYRETYPHTPLIEE